MPATTRTQPRMSAASVNRASPARRAGSRPLRTAHQASRGVACRPAGARCRAGGWRPLVASEEEGGRPGTGAARGRAGRPPPRTGRGRTRPRRARPRAARTRRAGRSWRIREARIVAPVARPMRQKSHPIRFPATREADRPGRRESRRYDDERRAADPPKRSSGTGRLRPSTKHRARNGHHGADRPCERGGTTSSRAHDRQRQVPRQPWWH